MHDHHLIQQNIIRSSCGRSYRLWTSNDKSPSVQLQDRKFNCKFSATRFLRDLEPDTEFWQRICHTFSASLPANPQPSSTFDSTAQLIISGKIRFYEISGNTLQGNHNLGRVIENSKGERFTFADKSATLIHAEKQLKRFISQKEAVDFLNSLSPDSEQLLNISKQLNVSTGTSNSAFVDHETLIETISKALANGEIILVAQKTNLKTKRQHEFEESFTNKPVALAPENDQDSSAKNVTAKADRKKHQDRQITDTQPRPRDKIKNLNNEEKQLIKAASTFKTVGVSRSEAIEFLSNSPEGEEFIKSLKAADPTASSKVIRERAIGLVQTGDHPPKLIKSPTKVIKIVPNGEKVSAYSPFFCSEAELVKAQESGVPLSDYFGLPAISDAAEYDIYQVEPLASATAFESKIAPTTELNGKFLTEGGGQQILVTNRSQWSAPVKLGSVTDN